MIEDPQLDKATVATLIPFPGTKLFKQVVKDRLFIKENENYDELWKTPQSLVQRDFCNQTLQYGCRRFACLERKI